MTVNYNFDLEDDDFFADNFLSFSEKDLLTSTAVPSVVSSDQELTDQPKKNAESKDSNHQQTSTSFLFDSIIKENKKDYLDKSKNILRNIHAESIKEDVHVSILSPLNDSVNNNLNIKSRFTPGFTPKARKRKFPGPAGVYTQQNKLEFHTCDLEEKSSEKLEEDLDIPGIASSQITADDLLLLSWQNLQKEVSSCQTLLSTAKYYSIHRVLNEASKKKLPKYLVVPVLCVLIKKFTLEDSSLLLMDDTGEISGKIDKGVLEEYHEYFRAGTALILKKVTFLCNVLLLKKQCIASVYLIDGSVNHIHELNSILDKEPPTQIGFECPGTPNSNKNEISAILKLCDSSLNAAAVSPRALLNNAIGCNYNTKAPNLPKRSSVNSKEVLNLPSCTSLNTQKFFNVPGIAASNKVSPKTVPQLNQNISLSKSTYKEDTINSLCRTSKASSSAALENANMVKSMTSVSDKNMKESDDFFCNDFEMDEFDELLCSLDEKSFLEEM